MSACLCRGDALLESVEHDIDANLQEGGCENTINDSGGVGRRTSEVRTCWTWALVSSLSAAAGGWFAAPFAAAAAAAAVAVSPDDMTGEGDSSAGGAGSRAGICQAQWVKPEDV